MNDNIREFEGVGTHPAANHNAISAPLAFHRAIGSERKVARLRRRHDRWAKRSLAASDRVKIPTQLDTPYSGAIALMSIDGLEPGKLSTWLLDKRHIVTMPIVHAEFSGVRITPNVYTTIDEINTFTNIVPRSRRLVAAPPLLGQPDEHRWAGTRMTPGLRPARSSWYTSGWGRLTIAECWLAMPFSALLHCQKVTPRAGSRRTPASAGAPTAERKWRRSDCDIVSRWSFGRR